jgi:hypothetical protein
MMRPLLKKIMTRLDAKSKARGVCVAAPNKMEQVLQLLGGVGQCPQILSEPELIMSTGVAAVAVAVAIRAWTARQAQPLSVVAVLR